MAQRAGVAEAVDAAWERAEKGPRPHLGASQVGKPCDRALVYGFRHAARKRTEGRMLRLWNRGHREEPSLIQSLRMIGMEVREYAQRLTLHRPTESYGCVEWHHNLGPDEVDVTHEPGHVEVAKQAGVEPRQWSFFEHGGHHAGSSDGVAMLPRHYANLMPAITPDVWFGLEFKTYNLKSFEYLLSSGTVERHKPEHYWQMQEYMEKIELPWQPGVKMPFKLYLAVCKNDDRLYDEIVVRRQEVGQQASERALRAVTARQLPPRFSNNATNFTCKYCDYRGPCHFAEPLAKSCRTCADAVAVVEGADRTWYCSRYVNPIPPDFVRQGCGEWRPITD